MRYGVIVSVSQWNRRVLALLAPVACAVAVAAAVSGRGCENREEAPKETVQLFFEAAKNLDREQMFSMLSENTRNHLQAQARIATDLSSKRYNGAEMIEIDTALAVFESDESARRISLTSQSDGAALVEITDNRQRIHQIHLVRERGQWRLVLLPRDADSMPALSPELAPQGESNAPNN